MNEEKKGWEREESERVSTSQTQFAMSLRDSENPSEHVCRHNVHLV